MTKLIALIMALTLTTTSVRETESKTTVTKIHEDDQITVLVDYKGNVKKKVLHGYDFNIPVVLHEDIPTETVVGKFTSEFTDLDGKRYYQFKSHDDTVWWALTESEIEFIPSLQKDYALLYCNNGTTKENKPCNCVAELECECEVYDDVFIEIYEEE